MSPWLISACWYSYPIPPSECSNTCTCTSHAPPTPFSPTTLTTHTHFPWMQKFGKTDRCSDNSDKTNYYHGDPVLLSLTAVVTSSHYKQTTIRTCLHRYTYIQWSYEVNYPYSSTCSTTIATTILKFWQNCRV